MGDRLVDEDPEADGDFAIACEDDVVPEEGQISDERADEGGEQGGRHAWSVDVSNERRHGGLDRGAGAASGRGSDPSRPPPNISERRVSDRQALPSLQEWSRGCEAPIRKALA